MAKDKIEINEIDLDKVSGGVNGEVKDAASNMLDALVSPVSLQTASGGKVHSEKIKKDR